MTYFETITENMAKTRHQNTMYFYQNTYMIH